MAPDVAWRHLLDWLTSPTAWVPMPGARYTAILGDLIQRHGPRGNLVTDVALAALAIEQDVLLYSADNDFARFRELRWENPLAADG